MKKSFNIFWQYFLFFSPNKGDAGLLVNMCKCERNNVSLNRLSQFFYRQPFFFFFETHSQVWRFHRFLDCCRSVLVLHQQQGIPFVKQTKLSWKKLKSVLLMQMTEFYTDNPNIRLSKLQACFPTEPDRRCYPVHECIRLRFIPLWKGLNKFSEVICN